MQRWVIHLAGCEKLNLKSDLISLNILFTFHLHIITYHTIICHNFVRQLSLSTFLTIPRLFNNTITFRSPHFNHNFTTTMPRGIFSCFRHRTSTTPTTSSDPTPIITGPGPVVLELFTSQGCATSPSAELLFSRIGRGDFEHEVPPVIILVYHVDYWDYNGWKDPFGSSQWTVRQKGYVELFNLDTMFTPHVVVQGVKQCIGNDEDGVMECIKGVSRYPSPAFEATFERPTPESLQITLKGALRAKLDGVGADIMVALCESGLVTDCQDGVNKDRMLANDFVVRKLTKLCSIDNLPPKKIITGSLECDLWQGFNSTKCGIVVFVQQHGTRHIFGSQRIQLPADI